MLRRISLLTLAVASLALAQTPPSYQARRTADAIVVDGRINEFTWAIAPQVGVFRHTSKPDAKVLPTQAAITWDDANMYVMFVCEDPQPWSDMMERDMHLWEQEVVELFLDPDGDGKDYPELEVSPHNVVVDLLIPAPRKIPADEAAKWDIAGLKTAVGKSAAGWTVEMSIPWKSLAESGVSSAPKIGDKWKVGLYRIERPGGLQANRDESKDEFQAWAITGADFHQPGKFGTVEFVLK